MFRHHQSPRLLGLGLLLGVSHLMGSAPSLAQQQQPALEQIGRLRETAVEALNTQEFDRVEPFLHPEFTITTVDNQIFHSVAEFESYWEQQLSGPIDRIEMTVTPDGETIFLSDQTGVNYGEAASTFYFGNGDVREMSMRWSSVVQEEDEEWLLQSLHFSANLLDNPVLSASRVLGRTIGIASGIGMGLIGLLIGLLVRRRGGPGGER